MRREDGMCKECGNGEVEDIGYFAIVMRCEYLTEERLRLDMVD